MDGMHNIGRLVPDLKKRTPEEQMKAEQERMYTRDLGVSTDTGI